MSTEELVYFFLDFAQLTKELKIGQVILLSGASVLSNGNGSSTWHVELLQGLTPSTLVDGVQGAE